MLRPKSDGDGRAGQAVAAPSPARSSVVLIVRKPLAVPSNRTRLPRAGLLLLLTRSILSRSTPAQLRSRLRHNRGRRCGVPRSRRIGRPDGAGASRCHRIVSRHRAWWYKPISNAETATRARIRWDWLGKRTSPRRPCLKDGTGMLLTHKLRILTVWDTDRSWIVLLPGHWERGEGARGSANGQLPSHRTQHERRHGAYFSLSTPSTCRHGSRARASSPRLCSVRH